MLQENIEDMKTYIVSKDYFPLTGLRYCKRSAHSGEDFYHQKLNTWFADAYENEERISVVLDGGEDGYGPSFLDEAFGNLVYDFGLEIVRQWLTIDSSGDPEWGESIETETFPIWEENRKKKIAPLKTEEHEEWFRIEDGKLEKKVWLHKTEQE